MKCPNCQCELELVASSSPVPREPKPLNLHDAITAHCAEQRVTGAWSPSWAAAAEGQLRKFEALQAPLTRAGVAEWKAALLGASLTPKTVNTHLTTLGTFCRWLIARGDLDVNPVQGQSIRSNGHKAADEQRLAFEPAEVAALLRAAAARGTAGQAGFVWSMAYTGARNEEIAQLRICDVKTLEGVTVFDLATMDAGQRRKNSASRRAVPVHTVLSDFLRTRGALVPQSGSEGLTANLWGFEAATSMQRYAFRASQWVNETLLPKLKASGEVRDDSRLTLYSLRHAVATQLKHKGVAETEIAELVGHTNSSMTTGRYGKRYPVVKLAEVVARIEWPLVEGEAR